MFISEEDGNSGEELQPCFMCWWRPVSKIRVIKLENDKELKICVDCLSKAKEDGKLLGKKIKSIKKAKPFIDGKMRKLREWEKQVWGR